MKKARMFPFERNRYFYGKLLTVRDFESEQKYFNDKRRLLNRLLFGSGVVAGMQVVAVDDKTITVEMGVAIDYLGREIVVSAPVTLKLSMIDGFTNNEYKKNVYLYVAYDEKGREPVHSVGNSTVRGEEMSEYNRFLESYRLYVKEEAPSPLSFEHSGLMEDIVTIYQDHDVRVTQRMPKYANPGDVIDVTLVVEKTLQTPRVSLSFDYSADGFDALDKEGNHVRFMEPGDKQDTEYRLSYSVKVQDRPGTIGKLGVSSGAVELLIGDNRVALDHSVNHSVEIISQPVAERILKDWYERSLDQAAEGYADQNVCLAKIGLLQLGPTYMIEQVERVPFGEYIPNAALMHRISRNNRGSSLHRFYAESQAYDLDFGSKPELDVVYHPERNAFDFKLGIPKPQTINDEMATGTIDVPLDTQERSGMRFFSRGKRNYVSEEIPHGLGEGQVTVVVGLEEIPDPNAPVGSGGAKVYFGSADVFKDTEYEAALPNITFGTLIYPDKGGFRIGMKLGGATEATSLRVRWWAFKKLPGDANVAIANLQAGLAEAAAGNENN
ncbi:hypothetical protein [Cohnella cholangitidis]|uniref:Uncharacterized protein n=1 Tax=Cohnella cholangitidis TaxID=2598458 RepID=A0A7G5BVW3_9BACL|nr:hypothetical protein [Cohnella cholangitidis]QMV41097.1 hypothetical protein FPL14_07730 [Cohnella cholangitidis]